MLQAIASRAGTGARGLGVAAFTLTGADDGTRRRRMQSQAPPQESDG